MYKQLLFTHYNLADILNFLPSSGSARLPILNIQQGQLFCAEWNDSKQQQMIK